MVPLLPGVGSVVSVAACCITDTVLLIPPPVTVTVPLLGETVGLAVAFIVKLPLLEPLNGDTVSHEFALLDAVHDVLDVTDTLVFDAAGVGDHVVGLIVRLAGATMSV